MLTTELRNWDGKDTDYLAEVYQRYSTKSAFISELLRLLDDTGLQVAASWLLKHAVDQGCVLLVDQAWQLLCKASKLRHWQSRLHVLQILPSLTIPDASVGDLECFLRANLQDTNKFVRAWSYGGFCHLAEQYPQYREEADAFVAMAMRDEAPSVKARLRQLGVAANR